MALSVSVQFAANAKHLPGRAQVRRWAAAAHDAAADGAVTIRYVDEKEGRALNRQYRGKDNATNVLTFVQEPPLAPFAPAAATSAKRRYAADIVICAPVIAREAREQRKPVAAHHGHMVVHGMLHAQGFDHEDEADATTMEAIEVAVLRRFRIKNPYEVE
jgi:probable rRNA maturation factor